VTSLSKNGRTLTLQRGSQRGATVQISHGNGSFGSGRNAGKIYLNRFEFYKTWNGLP
jgi:hypothetical protein